MQAWGEYCARVNGIDTNFSWAQLLGEGSCNGIYRGFARAVNRVERRRQRAGNRADVDDASAFRAEELHCFPRSQKYAQDIDIELLTEKLFVDLRGYPRKGRSKDR